MSVAGAVGDAGDPTMPCKRGVPASARAGAWSAGQVRSARERPRTCARGPLRGGDEQAGDYASCISEESGASRSAAMLFLDRKPTRRSAAVPEHARSPRYAALLGQGFARVALPMPLKIASTHPVDAERWQSWSLQLACEWPLTRPGRG